MWNKYSLPVTERLAETVEFAILPVLRNNEVDYFPKKSGNFSKLKMVV